MSILCYIQVKEASIIWQADFFVNIALWFIIVLFAIIICVGPNCVMLG